ncbi:PREDICTED: uncharacterized protein LOC109221994 [Nicotiana attenuata]|uniref:uncharacterized protein LOC109221994 n=1 Tax=Nicotiana attenuata TaxID=49451 RepID=UPI000905094C|nr:PREDICTED: uncharacterized protein LOC109221994 [Nicotiana attenuata]
MSTDEEALDSSSPMYMHPSENAGMMLVPAAFDDIGYRSWRRGVLKALSMKNKVGFITGKVKKPDPTHATFDQWERCDDMELEDRYDQTNGAKLYQLQKEISDLSQGTLDITGYYTKMKNLWEELNTLNAHVQCNCTCTCGAKANMHKAEHDRRLIQFLMGLNKVYTVVRGSILMMNPLPSIAQAFSILIQEEKQRKVKPHSQFVMESASLNASTGNNNFRTNYNTSGYNTRNAGNNANRGGYNSNKPRLFCDYCKKPGHSKDKCFKLRGYPQNSRYPSYGNNNKGKRIASNVFRAPNDGSNASEVEGDHHEEGRIMHHLTQEQYGKLFNNLEKLQVANTREKSGDMKLTGGAVNFAGTVACSSSIEHGPFTEEATGDW